MNMVQESFLHWLHNQRNHERLNNYIIYDGYYNGDHEVDVPPKVKAALQSELGTVCNYCRVVVDSAVDYICGQEIGIEVKQMSVAPHMGKIPHTPGRAGYKISHTPGRNQSASDAEALLYSVYNANQLFYEEMLKAVTLMGKKGDVFLKLYIEDNQIKVRVLRPDICFPRYRSDDYKEMLYCAIKWFDDEESDTLSFPGGSGSSGKKWKAQVFRPDVVEYYELDEAEETEHSEWKLIHVEENMLGFIPVIHVKNTIDDLEFGISDLQVMTDLQDALNKTLTDLLLTMDNQAFQRVFIFGSQTSKGISLSMEPGMITEVPNESGRIEVVQAADIAPFIQAMKEVVNQICSVTGVPQPPHQGGPISGYALRLHYIPLERKCSKKKIILKNRFGELNKMIFAAAKLLGIGDYTDLSTRMRYAGGLPVDDEAQMKIHEMELRDKIKSRRTVMQERGIEDVNVELAEIEAESRET